MTRTSDTAPRADVQGPSRVGDGAAAVGRETFGALPDGREVEAYTLRNAHGITARFMSLGGTVLSVATPDVNGTLDDVVLGYDSLDAYLDDGHFIGPIVGRYANRIANAHFTLEGVEYTLDRNEGVHCLHGGAGGFHRKLWNVVPFCTQSSAGAVLHYDSPAGEAGFPGRLDVRVTYTLDEDGSFTVEYRASTDAPTHVSLTQHMYFNLAGLASRDILGHELTIPASRITAVDARLIPTGALVPVSGTPFDFTTPQAIGARVDADDEQLQRGHGYDHNFVLDGSERGELALAARLRDPGSGRVMEVLTTEPGIQFYSGNSLVGARSSKHGAPYHRRQGLALETQHFPDSPNHPEFPSTVLCPGEEYVSRTAYRFSEDRTGVRG